MLKNKKNIKILLPIVIIIWGILIYKIVDAFSLETIDTANKVKPTFKAPVVEEKEIFEMLSIDSDPFLGTMYKKPDRKTFKTISVATTVNWPDVKFSAVVSDNKSKNSVYILLIGGKQYLLKKGESADEVTLFSGTNESVRVRFKGQTKEIPIM